MEKFIQLLFQVFDDTPIEELAPDKIINNIEEWDSIIVLSIIDLADRHFNKSIRGEDIESCVTIEDLYNLITR